MKQKTNLKIIVANPRSLSTITSRILMQYPDTKLISDLFIRNYMDNLPSIIKNEISIEKIGNSTEVELSNELKVGKNILLKDIGSFIHDFFIPNFRNVIKDHNPDLIYLVRHPKAMHISFQKMMDKEKELGLIPLEFIHNKEREEMYEKIWNLYLQFNGHIIITEELQENPNGIFKEIFDIFDWKYEDSYLKFKPLKEEGLPDYFNYTNLHWYEKCISSREFTQEKVDLDNITFKEDWVNKKIEKSMIFYNLFKEERKKKLLNRNN